MTAELRNCIFMKYNDWKVNYYVKHIEEIHFLSNTIEYMLCYLEFVRNCNDVCVYLKQNSLQLHNMNNFSILDFSKCINYPCEYTFLASYCFSNFSLLNALVFLIPYCFLNDVVFTSYLIVSNELIEVNVYFWKEKTLVAVENAIEKLYSKWKQTKSANR